VVGQYSRLHIGFVAELNAKARTRVRRLPQVYFVEKDQTYNIFAPEWHLDRIDQRYLPLDGVFRPPFWTEYMSMGRGVDIYILDSGIRYSHNEFGGRAVYGGFDFQPSTAPNGPGSDCMGHGTHVAALAGGSTVGVAREATLYSIRMIGCDGRTSTSTILRALEHVVEHKNPLKTVIMSMSFGVPVSASINLCVSIAHWNGIIPVASAGNNEFNSCRKSPASATHAFTVGATDRYDKTWHKTNYGRCVNIFAPGADIRSASDDSDYGYTVKSGTSMAAPLVSGAAAVILDRYPNFKPKQVMSRLINRSTKNKVNFVSFPFWATLLTPNRLLFVE
jgi:subtilisin family serine protease